MAANRYHRSWLAKGTLNLGGKSFQIDCSGDSLAQSASWAEFRAAAMCVPEGPSLVSAFEVFWHNHRHLGSAYKDLIWPRWGDDVDGCFAAVKGYAASESISPIVVNARSAQARRQAQQEILASLRGPAAGVRRSILKWLFRYNEIYMSVRDNHRYYVDRNWYELRRIYLSYGDRLVEKGVLAGRDDVFFLGSAEVEAGLAGSLTGTEAGWRVSVRRNVWQTTLHLQGPKFLKGWAPFVDRAHATPAEAEGTLVGIAASPGTATEVARVVYDVRQLSEVKDGEILVTRQTDPSWTTVFGRIGGLVLETGGVLSHGTSSCREYGLPCVTAVENATAKIPNGSEVALVGSEGTVRILSAA